MPARRHPRQKRGPGLLLGLPGPAQRTGEFLSACVEKFLGALGSPRIFLLDLPEELG